MSVNTASRGRRDRSLALQFIAFAVCFVLVNIIVFHNILTTDHPFVDIKSIHSITHSLPHLHISSTGEIPKIFPESKPHDVPKDGIAGCLLLKDDNDRLSEWLAYHWLTLPLKYLVVAVDPTGMTSPKHVLDIWRESDMGMDIVLWDDADYGHWINHELDDKHKHRDRQKRFLAECQRHHKAKGREYVAVIDPDEFVTYNTISDDEPDTSSVGHVIEGTPEEFTTPKYTKAMNKMRKALPTYHSSHKPILEYLHDQISDSHNTIFQDEICHLMVRLYFSAIENDHEISERGANVSQYGIDYTRYSTVRYFHHGKRAEFGMNRYGKVLVNLKKTPWIELDRDMYSIHQPNSPSCTQPLKPYINGILRVHHYLGSWEQYISREDVRRSREKYEEGNSANHGEDYQIQDWLHRFVQVVGVEKSKKLLHYAGIIDNGITHKMEGKDGNTKKMQRILDRSDYKSGRRPKKPFDLDAKNHYYDEDGKRWEMKQNDWVLTEDEALFEEEK